MMKMNDNYFGSKSASFLTAVIFLLLLCIAYSNHFNNPFEFDDFGSIVNNGYIRDLKNIPLFFTEVKCFGTNMGDLGYRPVVALLNATAYWMGGGLNPLYFHASIFFWYVIQLGLMFFVFKRIFELSINGASKNHIVLIALLAVAFYGLHAANAETINYMISISDSFSTLCIVASLLLYMLPFSRKYYLYLITAAIGIGTKETGVMFGPILFFYILFFEENVSLTEAVAFKKSKSIFNAIKKAFPALLFSFGLFFILQKIFISSLPAYGVSAPPGVWEYFYTQWFVIAHYIGNFILPLNLSVDPDLGIFDSVINQQVLFGLLVIFALVIVAFLTSRKKETRPIAFGIMWFFIALAPTSSFVPFYQISNDHRTFFPYIGLAMSMSWYVFLLIKKHKALLVSNRQSRAGIPVLVFLVLALHTYGTYQRNIVWSSKEKLWHDATVKGPANERAQMNYGLELMAVGKYEETLSCFKKTLEVRPKWAHININMAVLRDAMGFPQEAEMYFKNATKYQTWVPDGYYYYARWLNENGRIDEAIAQLEVGHKVSPEYMPAIELLNSIKNLQNETNADRIKKAEEIAFAEKTSGNYIDLSLVYYKGGMYKECIDASERALQLQPNNAIAYNIICSAYCAMKEWQKAADACNKALEIDPSFQRAKNNLDWAKGNLK